MNLSGVTVGSEAIDATSARRIEYVQGVARALEQRGAARDWTGSDPYDGLNASVSRGAMRNSPLALRILTQAVKRSPLNLRPVLGIHPGLSAATLGLAISAYARNGFLDEQVARAKAQRYVERLSRLRSAAFSEPCWGYHFDVQTRVFFYPRTSPNTIATAFAALGLLDAYEFLGDQAALELATGAGDFFLRHVPQTYATPGAYFAYLPGDTTPIHNANMLVCALLARLSALAGREEFARAAATGLEYTVSRQRGDGSWPYGERPGLAWVDGFHTGYVLDGVLTCIEAGVGAEAALRAWHRGLRCYAGRLIEDDGTPRYTPQSRYPIDGQSAAQALQTLSRARGLAPEIASRRWIVLESANKHLARPDGAYAFQRERLWTNRIAHPRWVLAPMLAALTHLIAGG